MEKTSIKTGDILFYQPEKFDDKPDKLRLKMEHINRMIVQHL
jgi:hypothetical protein